MEISPTAALLDVELATRVRRSADAEATEALVAQAAAIRVALHAGTTVADISRVTGLTTARIYQIRDGVR